MLRGRQLVFSDAELLVVDVLWPLGNTSCSAGLCIKVSNSFASCLVCGHNTYSWKMAESAEVPYGLFVA